MLPLPQFRQIIPGLGLSLAMAIPALGLERLQQHFLGWVALDGLVVAIMTGIVLHSLFGLAEHFRAGVTFAAKTVLEVAIVLLGGTISAAAVLQIGPVVVAAIVLVVVIALGLSYGIGRALGLDARLATLVACGNSICGNSAIMATAPVIKAPAEDVAASIAFTAALGVLVVLLLPLGVRLLGISEWQYGVIAGLSVYAVPQVLAATVPVGVMSTQIGTLVKLIRVLMLGPVVLGLGLLQKNRPRGVLPFSALVPWFILGFIAMMGARSLGLLPEAAIPALQDVSSCLTLVAMAALGLSVDLRSVMASGGRVLAAGFLSVVMLILLAIGAAFVLA
ncbi:putative sulfate exporter family transporter [Devosia sp.]|uniref:YeiH family protein n=1 Tax=Devosia sp. TaxID=1871048 RepID=UPI001B2BA35B|nr:putative sulfate exporter family transporter [Devosia sp.]MBO9589440.1 putative sulfate exporter family transporter [Devosia sp.]